MPQTNEIIVEAAGLTKVFKDFWNRPKARAVNGIDFSVKRGQVFGLLGPNGSGKSTTVKMVLGLLHPTRGKLEVFGREPRDVNIKRRIGYLPEETYLYKYLTAAETLDFFGALFSLTDEERTNRSRQLLEMVGLANSLDRPVGEFSKGMARRIGLAQALINDPDLVILDEPTSGLDPIGCREVKDVIRLLAARGKTIILCSHLLADVQDVCDEVVVLYGGKIRTEGSLDKILTVEDKTRVTSPKLPAEAIAEIESIIHKYNADGEISVDQPTMDLEDFFLEVVRQARDASVETAGVQAGGSIAEYLRGDDDEKNSPNSVLAALNARTEEVEQQTVEETPEVVEPEVDKERLEKLGAETKQEEPKAKDDSEKAAEIKAEKEAASEKLKDLLK